MRTWATHQGVEIDLLLRRGDRLLGVECTRADAPKLAPPIRIALDDLGRGLACEHPRVAMRTRGKSRAGLANSRRE